MFQLNRLFYLSIIGLLHCPTTFANKFSSSEAWLESCPNKSFCFQHPQDLIRVKVQTIDSQAGQFTNSNLVVTYDLGWYASDFNDMKNAEVKATVIDGKKADILVSNNLMALRIPKVNGSIRFSMSIMFNNKIDSLAIETAQRIFYSIKFIYPINKS